MALGPWGIPEAVPKPFQCEKAMPEGDGGRVETGGPRGFSDRSADGGAYDDSGSTPDPCG